MLAKVREFQDCVGVPAPNSPLIPERFQLRCTLIEEEVSELRTAVKSVDVKGVLDALVDVQYVLIGT
eukprot:5872070-Amphidinium_carterae.1